MKKIKLLLFTLFLCLISIGGVSAAKILTCSYAYASGGVSRSYDVTLSMNGDEGTISKVIYLENNRNTGKKTEEDVTSKLDSTYVKMKESEGCPETLFITSVQLDVGTHYSLLPGTEKSEDNGSSQCYNYKSEISCKNSVATGKVACVWNENESAPNGGYCNVDNLLYVGCGGASDIPQQVPALISLLVNLLKIATPIILIFISIITLVKAMAAQKEDEIKKATSSLIKKIIAAVLVFFVVAIVQFIVSVVAEDEYTGFENCLNCFLNNKCKNTTYYKTVVGDEEKCTILSSGERDDCDCILNNKCD